MADAMLPEHPRWDEFLDRLEGPEGCDFKEDENGEVTWTCGGRFDKSHAHRILKGMGLDDAAIEESFAYYTANGGHCDCEILFNVADA